MTVGSARGGGGFVPVLHDVIRWAYGARAPRALRSSAGRRTRPGDTMALTGAATARTDETAPPAVPADAPEQALPADDAGPREPDRVLLHMPVDVRSASLILIAFMLGIYALKWAAPVVIPILMSVLFCYALGPLVDRLRRVGVPRALGAAVVM